MTTQPDKLVVTQEAYAFAEDAVGAANIVSHGGYYELDTDAVAQAFQRAMNQAADERQEMCAKVAEELYVRPMRDAATHVAEQIATAIRSIGKGGM